MRTHQQREWTSAELLECSRALQRAGYEVIIGDIVNGRREEGNTIYTASVDRAGRIRVSMTTPLSPELGARVAWRDREIRLLQETHVLIHAISELSTPAEVPDLLGTIHELLHRPIVIRDKERSGLHKETDVIETPKDIL